MKVALIHLSDLHVKSKEDFLVLNVKHFAAACAPVVNTCEKVIVAVTGDVVDRGQVANYPIAERFFREFEELIHQENADCTFDYIFVPGNHDLDYDHDPNKNLRPAFIDWVSKKDEVNEEVIEKCLSPQAEFWKFYSKVSGKEIPACSVHEEKIILDENHSMTFMGYNTSIFMQKNEAEGVCLVPENVFCEPSCPTQHNIIFTLFHHNPCWLTTQTQKNNRAKFIAHLSKTTQFVLCGHEHNKAEKTISDLNGEKQFKYLEAESLQVGDHQSCGIHVFNTDNWETVIPYTIEVVEGAFKLSSPDKTYLVPEKSNIIGFTEKWNSKLSSIGAPITHPSGKELVLSDIYVYPDLLPLTDLSGDKVYVYQDALDILEDSESQNVYILQGASQSGRTSLLKMYIRHLYQSGVCPIYINGRDVKNEHILNVLKDAYKEQYGNSEVSYEQFLAKTSKDKRVVLIDNIDLSQLNANGQDYVCKELLKSYDKVFVTSKDNLEVRNLVDQNQKNTIYCQYHIEPLGYEKRNELIDKWVKLGQDRYTIQEDYVTDQIKTLFNHITSLLGKELIPAYPIFILTLLQMQSVMIDKFPVNRASYATLYDTLLKGALHKAGINAGDYDGIIGFLSTLAYRMYKSGREYVRIVGNDSVVGYNEEYDTYKERRNIPIEKGRLLSMLILGIFEEVDTDVYRFSYKYIYYYLVAMYLSKMLGTEECKKEIDKFRDTLYNESSSNILVFLAYLDNNQVLLSELQFATWLPFEKFSEATLSQEDPLFTQLSKLVPGVKQMILKMDTDSKEERKKQLKQADKRVREVRLAEQSGQNVLPTAEDYMKDPALRDACHTLRITSIIGQVVKNQRDTIDRDVLIDIIKDTYKSNFRFISFFAKSIEDDKQEIVDSLLRDNPKLQTMKYDEVEEKIARLLQLLLLRVTLSVFSHLSVSVGTSGIDEYFEKVAQDIDSPAAEIITFTIKSYYAPMKITDLERLMSKYRNNIVVKAIIRSRVCQYVYDHNLPRKTKQRLGNICGLKMIDSHSTVIAQRNKK